jgi:hypothetical protein
VRAVREPLVFLIHVDIALFCRAKAALLELYVPYARGHDLAMRTLRAVSYLLCISEIRFDGWTVMLLQAMARPDVATLVDTIAANDERVVRAMLYLPHHYCCATPADTIVHSCLPTSVIKFAVSIPPPLQRGSSLEELLLVPLDRIGEYRDLLSQLLALSQPQDRGYTAISDAVEMFTQIQVGTTQLCLQESQNSVT